VLKVIYASPLVAKVLTHLISVGTVVTLISWITALLGAFLTFAIRSDHGYQKNARNFMRFCFPSAILRSNSCRLDAMFVVSQHFLAPLLLAPVLLTSVGITVGTHHLLETLVGSRPVVTDSLWLRLAILAVGVVIQDGVNFGVHYYDHKLKFMWEFHKVHHASTFLIPLTNRREHPVQSVFDETPQLLAVGVWIGLSTYLLRMPIGENLVLGMDAWFFANLLSFYHLRHSHIPMSYGWLENFVMSPAQHQLHHSYAVHHWDRNFGLLLSVWDKMAGTFVRSAPHEVRLGLPAEYANDFNSLVKLYVTPLRKAALMATGWISASLRPAPQTDQASAQGADATAARSTSAPSRIEAGIATAGD
jgi:sterol desaturase/sphingolipid hydroxylase (fatty acid hydroxylase superfamily)